MLKQIQTIQGVTLIKKTSQKQISGGQGPRVGCNTDDDCYGDAVCLGGACFL